MTAYEMNLLWLYPDILNLHGDRGNVMALEQVADHLGVKLHIRRVERLSDPIDLAGVDLVFAGAGELAVMPAVLAALMPHQTAWRAHAKAGHGFWVSGTSAALVANQTHRLDGTNITGLGLVDLAVYEREKILGDDLILQVGDQELNGIQIRLTDLRLAPGQAEFGQVVYGFGNSADQPACDGARRQNLITTNLLGPALVKNPWFTARYLSDLVAVRHPEAVLSAFNEADWALERQAADAVRRFCHSKKTLPGTIRS